MSVLDRSMFIKPMPVVRRETGSSILGEMVTQTPTQKPSGEKSNSIFGNIANFFSEGRAQGDDSTVYDFGEYGGKYDLKETGFQRVLMNYLPEGASLFSDPENFILSDAGKGAIEAFRADIEKMKGMNRAEGSPMQGEMAQPRPDVENVGIMDGFNDPKAKEIQQEVLQEGERQRKDIAESDDFEELMQAIRGDNGSEEDRRNELATVVGEKDAEATPDSVLVLVQPVMQMLSAEEKATGIGQMESGEMAMPTNEAEGIAQRPMVQNFAIGGLAQPIKKFSTGKLVSSYEDTYLPLYMSLKDKFVDKDAGAADALMALSRAGFSYGMGAPVEQSAALFFDEVGKKGSDRAKTEAALEGKLSQAALSSAIASDLKQQEIASKKKSTFVMTGNKKTDAIIGMSLGYDNIADFYRDYPNTGTIFTFEGGSLTSTKVPDKKTESFNVLGVAGNEEDRVDIERLGLDFDILPPNTQVGIDQNGKIQFVNAPTKEKIQYSVTYPTKVGDSFKTTTVILDLSNSKDLENYNRYLKAFMDSDNVTKKYYQFDKIGSLNVEGPTINVENITQQAEGGFIQKRSSGSNEDGEVVEEPLTDVTEFLDLEESTPIIKEGSSAEQVLLQKANQGEAALKLLDQLYYLALTKPQYFGIMGLGASYGKSGYLSVDQILESMTGMNLPEIKFLEAPEIDEIAALVDSISSKLASVEKEGTFRSVTNKEKSAKADLLNVYAGNANRTMDSIKQIRQTLVDDINRFYDQTGNANKEFGTPDFYNTDPKDSKNLQFEMIKDQLPPDMLEAIDTDPLIKQALEAIIAGEDPQLVIKKYKEIKGQ
tara:strand:- start:211 stop:2682 length:2472 start_codon:yes stop_codon:yes gene_type:complete